MRFDTFNEVANWYERTKPLISKHHDKQCDIRPIGDRRRKWERIKKISDTEYALLDGCYTYTSYIGGRHDADAHARENSMAPIVWKRESDGDYIYIRNYLKQHKGPSRYDFLTYNLPRAMRFVMDHGKHWVTVGGQEYRLPKWEGGYDRKIGAWGITKDAALKFRANPDGTFTRTGEPLKVQVQRVDREAKKEWKDKIEAYYAYLTAIAPMLQLDWEAQKVYREQVREWTEETGVLKDRSFWPSVLDGMTSEVFREVISDEHHPIRVPVTAFVGAAIYIKREIESEADIKSIRAAYNRLMNKHLGLHKMEEV